LTTTYRPETEAYTTHLAELLIKRTVDDETFRSRLEENIEPGGGGKHFTPPPDLRILDVCSGSGCISLLLHYLLSKSERFPKLQIKGVDISEDAVALANENLRRNVENRHLPISASLMDEHPRKSIKNSFHRISAANSYDNLRSYLADQDEGLQISSLSGHKSMARVKKNKRKSAAEARSSPEPEVQFLVHDIFTGRPRRLRDFDVIISNPPYISQEAFKTDTSRSVKNWEPKLALVPSTNQNEKFAKYLKVAASWDRSDAVSDVFYLQLLRYHDWLRSKVLLMEIGDAEQAVRVVKIAQRNKCTAKINRFEIWRDWPDQDPQPGEEQTLEIGGHPVPIKGAGKMRAVLLFRTHWAGRGANGGAQKRRPIDKLPKPPVLPGEPRFEIGWGTSQTQPPVDSRHIWVMKKSKRLLRKKAKKERKRERKAKLNEKDNEVP
jgi:methylase of polypeptide subunit release factors